MNENDEDQEGRKMDKYKKLKNNPKCGVRCKKLIDFACRERKGRCWMARRRWRDKVGGGLAASPIQWLDPG